VKTDFKTSKTEKQFGCQLTSVQVWIGKAPARESELPSHHYWEKCTEAAAVGEAVK
jgi:hypothetical protein